jgi:hypothetical protein
MTNILNELKELEEYEHESVKYFSPSAYGDLQTSSQRTQAARTLFRLNSSGSSAGFKDWGNYVKNLPILWQLTIQPTLIVDLEPLSHDDFVLRTGITPEQFAILAREGFIIPNLYEYESDQANGFVKHQRFAESLMPILSEWRQTNCRINYIRRQPLLNAIFKGNYDNLVSQAKLLFESAIRTIPENQLKNITGSSEVEGAIHKVSINWAYVQTFYGEDTWTKGITASGVTDIARDLRRLHARYSITSAPYTAALGGAHLVSPRQIAAISEEDEYFQIVLSGDRVKVNKELSLGLEALHEIGSLRASLGSSISGESDEIPAVVDEKYFNNFLKFLIETKGHRYELQNFLTKAQQVSTDIGLTINHWKDYFELEKKLKIEAARFKKGNVIKRAASWGAGGALSSMILSSIKIDEFSILGLGGIGFIFGAASSVASDLMHSVTPESHRKLIFTFDELRKWQQNVINRKN